MKKLKLFLAMGVMLMAASCGSGAKTDNAAQEQPADNTEVQATEAGVIQLADDNQFRPETAVEKPVVLDFNATWCIPCKKLTPAYHKAAEEYQGQVAFYSVDIDQNPLTTKAFGVETVPTVVILAPGKEMQKWTSLNDFITEEQLKTADGDQVTEIILGNLKNRINGGV